jgi:hypothetical protein
VLREQPYRINKINTLEIVGNVEEVSLEVEYYDYYDGKRIVKSLQGLCFKEVPEVIVDNTRVRDKRICDLLLLGQLNGGKLPRKGWNLIPDKNKTWVSLHSKILIDSSVVSGFLVILQIDKETVVLGQEDFERFGIRIHPMFLQYWNIEDVIRMAVKIIFGKELKVTILKPEHHMIVWNDIQVSRRGVATIKTPKTIHQLKVEDREIYRFLKWFADGVPLDLVKQVTQVNLTPIEPKILFREENCYSWQECKVVKKIKEYRLRVTLMGEPEILYVVGDKVYSDFFVRRYERLRY